MAIKRFILFVGDSNAAGANVGTDLTPAGWGSLTGIQTDYMIWNLQTPGWESYNAGSNSYTSIPGSNLFGPEVNFFKSAVDREVFAPGEKMWCFKLAQYQLNLLKWNDSLTETGGANPGGVDYHTLWPQARDLYYTFGRSQLATAIAALEAGGDTVQFEGVAVIMGTLDAIPEWGKLAYERLILEFVQQLIQEVNQISATNTTKPVAVLVNTHNDYDYTLYPGGAAAARARFQTVRIGTEIARLHLDSDPATSAAKLVTTLDLQTLRATVSPADYVHFDVNSVVALGDRISNAVWKTSDTTLDFGGEPANPVDLYLMIGDSHCVGWGDTTELPAHLGTVDETFMWYPPAYHATNGWQEIVPGLTNNPTRESPDTRFGPEITFAEEARQTNRRPTYIIKLGVDGASIANSSFDLGSVFPFFDGQKNDFNPASNELYQELIGWINDAVDNLINVVIGPGQDRIRFRGGIILLGTNDSRQLDDGLQASEVAATLKQLIVRLRDHFANYVAETYEPILNESQESGTNLPFIVVQPDGSYASLPLAQNYTNTVRAAVRQVAEEDDYVGIHDPTGLYTFRTGDTTHYSSAGNLDLGKALFAALNGSLVEVVQPLFVASKTQLVNRLRLKGVPSTSNAQDLIDESIQLVKTHLFRRLGRQRINYLKSLALNPAPQSENDFIRLMASSTEIAWVRLELMRIMPMMFVDGNVPNEVWQHEAAFREATIAQIASEMRRIRAELEENLQVLAGELSPTEFNRVRVSTVQSDVEPPDPGDSVRIRGGVY